jgi:pheromone shutdown protein TraB
VQPDVVVVELCQYRVSMLKMDERTLLREAKEVSLEKLQQAVRQVRTWASQVCMGP